MIGCACGHERYGYSLKDGVLTKTVEKSKHQLNRPPAWCVQREVIDFHFERGEVTRIDIINAEPPYESYSIEIQKFMEVAKPMERRYGPQYMVGLKYWNVTKRGKTDEKIPKQLSLI